MPEPQRGRTHVRFTADLAAAPDAVFDYFTSHFDEIWPGKLEHRSAAPDPAEPMGLGFVRTMHTAAGVLHEEIVTHERPRLIEYEVINGDEPKVKIHNHLGRIEFSEAAGGGTHIDYTIDFDYRPPWQGPVVAAVLRATWALKSKRALRKALG